MAPRKPKQEKPVETVAEKKAFAEKKSNQVTKTAKKVVAKKKAPKKQVQPVKEVEKEIRELSKDEHPKSKHTRDRGPLFIGAGLLVMGFLLLLAQFLRIPFGDFLWPFIFIVPGALVFLSAISSESASGEGLSILGGILSMLGLVFLMQTITGLWASWAYIWALVAPTSIGLSQVAYGNLKKRDNIAASGWRLTKIGLSLFIIGFLFFELVIGISGFGLGRFGLPVFPMILILVGGLLLARSFLRTK